MITIPVDPDESWEARQHVRRCSNGHLEAARKGDVFRNLRCAECGSVMVWVLITSLRLREPA